MSASSQPARKSSLDEVLNESVQARATKVAKVETTAAADEFANIEANPFFQAALKGELSPEERRKQIAALLVGSEDKASNRESAKALKEFRAFIQAHRLAMSEELIALTGTKTAAEIKRVYDELNDAMLEFEKKIEPLVLLIDSLYKLRTKGKVFDILRKIKADREQVDAAKKERASKAIVRKGIDTSITDLETENAELGEQKSFWGVGGVKESARVKIAKNLLAIKDLSAQREALDGDMAALDVKINQVGVLDDEFGMEEAQLRKMLDVTAAEHEANHVELIDSALKYVRMTKERTDSVQKLLGESGEHIERLLDANTNFGHVYAVLSDGVTDAVAETRAKVEKLNAAPEGGSLTEKMMREEGLTTLNSHITVLEEAQVATMEGFSDLTIEKARVKAMGDANTAQYNKVERYNSEGVAGVASRISTVLTAVGEAALGEAGAMLGETMSQMTSSTNKIAQKEVIRSAMGIDERNKDLEKVFGELSDFSAVVRSATTINKEGLAELRSKLDQVTELAQGLQEDIHESYAAAAAASRPIDKEPEAAKAKSASPFDFSKRI